MFYVIFTLLGLFPFSLQAANQEKWVNWLGNASCVPFQYAEPRTLDELKRHIQEAATLGLPVHVVGNGYSRNDMACTDGKLLNLKHFNHILSIDRKHQTVRVEAGITLQELNEQLFHEGLAISNQPAMAKMSLGGALCTAVHGTGHTGTLSSFVHSIDLLISDGTMRHLSAKSDPAAFAAAKVSLGALGILYAVTLKCEPSFHLHADHVSVDIQNVIDHYQTLYESNDFFQFIWNIPSGRALVQRWHRNSGVEASVAFERSDQALTWFEVNDSNRDLATEIAVPMEHLPIALIKTKQLIEKYQAKGVVITDIVVRFVEADDEVYLSPAAGRKVAYLAIASPMEDSYVAFYEELEKMMYVYQGRPHWGKILFLDHEKAAALYGKNLQKFIHVKQRLDPKNMFSNNFTDRILKSN